MARHQSYFAQAKNAKSAPNYTQTSGKPERVTHQTRESELIDVCVGCVLDECTGGGRHCPYRLKKKAEKKEKKHEKRET